MKVEKHKPVSDEDFINALPPAGLQIAAECLEQDLETLQENALPVAGTVRNLLHVHSRLSNKQKGEASA